MVEGKFSNKVARPAACLVPLAGQGKQPSVPLAKRITLIGSGPGAHLCLRTQMVDEIHAVIVNADGRVFLRDLASRDGTWVNGAKITSTELQDGDKIRIGNIEVRFEAGPPSEFTAAVESEPAELRWTDGAHELSGRVVLIGSDPRCDLRLSGEDCLEKHAIVVAVNGQWQLRSLKLGPMTQLNGQVVRREKLSDGDRLLIGTTELQYVIRHPQVDAVTVVEAQRRNAPAPAETPRCTLNAEVEVETHVASPPEAEPQLPPPDEPIGPESRPQSDEPASLIEPAEIPFESAVEPTLPEPVAPPTPAGNDAEVVPDLTESEPAAEFSGSSSDADRVVMTEGAADRDFVRAWGPLAVAMAASQKPEPQPERSGTEEPAAAPRFRPSRRRWLIAAGICAAIVIALLVWVTLSFNR